MGLMAGRGLAAILVLVGAAAFAAMMLVFWRRARVLEKLARAWAALGEGQAARPIRARVGGSVGRLARIFDDVAPGLEDRIASLERDLQQLRLVLEGMAEGVIAVDARRRLLFANEAADRLFGIGPSAVGRLVAELIRHPQVLAAIEATLGPPGSYRGEILLAGREALAQASARVLDLRGSRLPGNPPGAVMVFHDVTDLRRLERMRQDFVANASHELKTPLASIKAYTETLLDWALHDDRLNVRYLQQIDEQADRLNRLIFDLLSLARLESGQDVFQHGPLLAGPVVRSSAEAQRARAESKGLRFELEIAKDDESSSWVLADEEAIRQILDNLIDNAIKYTPEGGWVRVGCRLEGGQVVLEVADSGIGIPRDDVPRIFERFYRVDKARSRELGGTGLGLSIVKHLVQSIGGAIDVTSRLGAGSRFTIRLPWVAPAPM
jgi:two-component system phosphate regulon sensor histidine kinase PhoR